MANFLALLNRFLAVCKHSVCVWGNIPGPEKYDSLGTFLNANFVYEMVYNNLPETLLSCAVIFPSLNLMEFNDFLSLSTEQVWCLHCPVSGITTYWGRIFQASVATIFKASRTNASSVSDMKKGKEILQKPGLRCSLWMGISGALISLIFRTRAISFCL